MGPARLPSGPLAPATCTAGGSISPAPHLGPFRLFPLHQRPPWQVRAEARKRVWPVLVTVTPCRPIMAAFVPVSQILRKDGVEVGGAGWAAGGPSAPLHLALTRLGLALLWMALPASACAGLSPPPPRSHCQGGKDPACSLLSPGLSFPWERG